VSVCLFAEFEVWWFFFRDKKCFFEMEDGGAASKKALYADSQQATGTPGAFYHGMVTPSSPQNYRKRAMKKA
jgi:hypothetical protein